MDNNTKYWLALTGIKGIGSAITTRLIDRFKTPVNVFQVSLKELSQVRGISEEIAAKITGFSGWEDIKEQMDRAASRGIKIVGREDGNYPASLLNIYDPPPVIYSLGELMPDDGRAVAIVGARNPSSYGLEITENFSYSLAKAGVTVISGMARGIDTAAHRGALKAGGRTIAVLGCGLDTIYPPENRKLFVDIQKSGAIISEFPLGTSPNPGNFPRRNRIISGLSFGVVVVEASLKSGSLITARHALDQGREVYAIPGNVNSPGSKGTNSLIKEGAKLVERPEEVLEDILPQGSFTATSLEAAGRPEREFKMTDHEKNIFSSIGPEPIHIDDLAKACSMEMKNMTSTLLSLELMGAVRQLPGKMFTKSI